MSHDLCFSSLSLILFSIVVILQFNGSESLQRCNTCGVQRLSAEADFRAVKLSWGYLYAQEPPAFRVKYCEQSSSKIRCRQKVFPMSKAVHGKGKWLQKNLPPYQYLGKLIRPERGSYQTSILDLRMMTNYSFNVEADFSGGFSYNLGIQPPSTPYFPSNQELFPVSVETKGFSGKTITCLGNTSEVAVNTGPYFNGKISVEGTSHRECSIFGNRTSSLDLYTMSINHTLCGSKIVNNSRIETMIIVHENKEILTHNSRRFLVVCNFPSDTYTLTASVDVPPHLLKKNAGRRKPSHVIPPKAGSSSSGNENENSHGFDHHREIEDINPNDPNHISLYDNPRLNHVRDSRILALQREQTKPKISEDEGSILGTREQDHFITTCCFFIGIIACTWILWLIMSRNDQYISEGSDAAGSVIKSTSPSSSLSSRQSSFSIHDPIRSAQHAGLVPSASSSPSSLSSLSRQQHFHHTSPVSSNVILVTSTSTKTNRNSSLLETSLN